MLKLFYVIFLIVGLMIGNIMQVEAVSSNSDVVKAKVISVTDTVTEDVERQHVVAVLLAGEHVGQEVEIRRSITKYSRYDFRHNQINNKPIVTANFPFYFVVVNHNTTVFLNPPPHITKNYLAPIDQLFI